MKTRLLKTALCASTLFATALVAAPVHADSLNVTLSSNSVSVTEGDSGTLVFTLTNNEDFGIILDTFKATIDSPTGDTSDKLDSLGVDSHLTTCGTDLGAMSTCNWVLDFTTVSGAGETDGDSGVAAGSASQTYDIAAIGVGYVANAPPFTLTVNDVPLATTPEPSSLLLLGSGLLGVLGLGRKRLI